MHWIAKQELRLQANENSFYFCLDVQNSKTIITSGVFALLRLGEFPAT